MIIYLHEDISDCPFATLQETIDIVCWQWTDVQTGIHICMGIKNRCGCFE